MKSRASRSSATSSSSICTFLKPGALAQIRNSKIEAKSRSKRTVALMALAQMNPVSVTTADRVDDANRDVGLAEIPYFVPNFKNRYQVPRSILRKKLMAAMPILTES